MNGKIYSIIISFFLGCFITCGVGYYIFTKTNQQHNTEIQRRENIITTIKEDLNSTKLELDRIAKINNELGDNNIEAIRILDRAIECQSEIGSRLQEGTIQE